MSAGPFDNSEVEEVFLPRAPLLFALTQIRFPKTPHLAQRSSVDKILSRVSTQLPILREEAGTALVVAQSEGQNLMGQPQQRSVFRFLSKDEKWGLSLTEESISLETTSYVSREDFIDRFRLGLEALLNVGPPVTCDRIGVRYVDQIRLKDLSRLPSFIRPEVLGISSVPITPGELIHSFTQSLIRLHDHEVALRWGIIPAGVNFDPTFPATTETSWVLDIDVYTTKKTDFDVDTIVNLERTFADTAYRLFRWSTTKELIEWAGGSLHG